VDDAVASECLVHGWHARRVDPSQFYTGIVAELYAPLRGVTQDPDAYARFIAFAGEPALELGCGGGDPLLELRRRGLDVDGVDSSADMLDVCRRRAAEQGIAVTVHHQSMEALDLSRRYRSIFLAGPTFNLLPDDDIAVESLRRIRAHLADGGSALVPLFIPEPTTGLGAMREATEPDGAVIRVGAIAETRDDEARCQVTTLRYQRVTPAETTTEDRPWVLHWHTQDGFRALAETAGLRVTAVLDAEGNAATADAASFVFVLN
jgi:SAM-dependent methyltransferase